MATSEEMAKYGWTFQGDAIRCDDCPPPSPDGTGCCGTAHCNQCWAIYCDGHREWCPILKKHGKKKANLEKALTKSGGDMFKKHGP